MKIVVTGAAGHIGVNLIRGLLERGSSVCALVHRVTAPLAGLGVTQHQASITDAAGLEAAFTGAKLVFHLASHISLLHREQGLMQAVNVEGTQCVVNTCRAAGVRRLVHFSSIEALSPHPIWEPVTEDRPLIRAGEASPYAESKAAAERIVRAAAADGLDCVIIYPTAVFGPHDYYPSFFGQALIRMAEGRLPALLSAGFDWVDVRDVVAGTLQAAEQAPTGGRFLLSGHQKSIAEIAAAVAGLSGTPTPRFTVPIWLAKLAAPLIEGFAHLNGTSPLYTRTSLHALSAYHLVSSAQAAAAFGYAPRPFDTSLIDTLEWFAREGMITGTPAADILKNSRR